MTHTGSVDTCCRTCTRVTALAALVGQQVEVGTVLAVGEEDQP